MAEAAELTEAGHFSDKLLPGDLVWVKFTGYIIWPSRIAAESEVAPPIRRMYKETKPFLVYFFGSHDFAWVGLSQMFEWEPNFEKFSTAKGCKGKQFQEGLMEALRWEKGPKVYFVWKPEVVVIPPGSSPGAPRPKIITAAGTKPPHKVSKRPRSSDAVDGNEDTDTDSDTNDDTEDEIDDGQNAASAGGNRRDRVKELIKLGASMTVKQKEELARLLDRRDAQLKVMRKLGLAPPTGLPSVWQLDKEEIKILETLDLPYGQAQRKRRRRKRSEIAADKAQNKPGDKPEEKPITQKKKKSSNNAVESVVASAINNNSNNNTNNSNESNGKADKEDDASKREEGISKKLGQASIVVASPPRGSGGVQQIRLVLTGFKKNEQQSNKNDQATSKNDQQTSISEVDQPK